MPRYAKVLWLFWKTSLASELEYRLNFLLAVLPSLGHLAGNLFEWTLDQWQDELRWIELEITGADLLAAGVPEGPRVGAGLDAALAAKVSHGLRDADAELEIALEAAKESRE